MSEPLPHPDLAAYVAAPSPAFLFSADGTLIWANAAAAVYWDALDVAALLRHDWRATGLPAQLELVLRSLAPGAQRLDRLRLTPFGVTVPFLAQVTHLRLPERGRALLAVGTQKVAAARLARMAAALPADLVGTPSTTVIVPPPVRRVEPVETTIPAEAGSVPIFRVEGAPSGVVTSGDRPETPPRSLVQVLATTDPAPSTDAPTYSQDSGVVNASEVQDVGTVPTFVVEPTGENAVLPAHFDWTGLPDEIPNAVPAETSPAETTEPVAIELSAPVLASVPVRPDLTDGDDDGASSRTLDPRADLPLRFAWETSAEGHLVYVTPNVVAALGAEAMPDEQETFAEFARRNAVDGGDLATRLDGTEAWSGLEIAWPLAGEGRADVVLSATPMTGEDGFTGFRGYGLVRGFDTGATTPTPPEDDATTAFAAEEPSSPPETAPPAAEPIEHPEPDPPIPTLADADLDAAEAGSAAATEFGSDTADSAVTAAPDHEPTITDRSEATAGPPPIERPDPAHAVSAQIVPFPGPPGGAPAAERKLAPADAAALRTIARVLGGPIGLPPTPENAPEAPVRLLPSATEPPASAAALVGEHAEPAQLPILIEPPLPLPAQALAVPLPVPLPPVIAAPRAPRMPESPPPAEEPRTPVVASAFYVPVAALPPAPVIPPPAVNHAQASELADARARAAELTDILDTATDGVIVLSSNGRIQSMNHAAQALFGIDGTSVHGDPLTRLLAPESHRAATDYLEGLLANGVASVLNDGREVVGLERNGGRIPLFLTLGRLAGGRFCAVMRDITQWKAAEAELTAAKRLAEAASNQKSDFLAKISHEIRTPLNAIIGFSEVMLDEGFGRIENQRYRGYVADIRASGEHLLSLVNDLLDLSKIEAGKLDLNFSAVALNELVQQAVSTMQPQANREGVILRTALPRIPAVVADQRSIRQILFNLLSNAVKFTKAGGQVIVSTATTDAGEVMLRVRDTGIGMTPAEIALSLEPFRQVATRSPAQRHGTGLGLPLTKALAESNRAAFAIESAPGEGTLVSVTFPPTRVLTE